ncbi:MAG: hypothetical protein PHT33_07605 [bacterium]|nr:hypothetical protein [bacterium]
MENSFSMSDMAMLLPPRFDGKRRFVLTGDMPFNTDDLSNLLGYYHDVRIDMDYDTERTDYLIIGRRDFDKEFIESIVDEYVISIKYLPQEAIIDQLLFGHDWYACPEYLLEFAEMHHGLQFLQTCEGFKWPDTEAEETDNVVSNHSPEWNEQSALKALGYCITNNGRYTTDAERWKVLTLCVDALSLERVVSHIAWLVRSKKRQIGGRSKFRNSILKWERDLERLRATYYKHDFHWPNYEL